jgi:hypothetical protein
MTLLFVLLAFGVYDCYAGRGQQLVGYWENWVDENWWDTTIPGNCFVGCAEAAPFFTRSSPHSVINYGFTFLTQNPNPKQKSCENSKDKCPVWTADGLYAASFDKSGEKALAVTGDATVHDIDNFPALVSISEVCRLARQGPNGPKRCLVSLGGWSDWARIGTIENAKLLASMAANMVALTFADGIDLDFEHLSEYDALDKPGSEFVAYTTFVNALRAELNKITTEVWVANAQGRYNDLQSQQSLGPYYPTNMKYMQELQKNGVPYLEISWTTRFNAFLNHSAPFNYLEPSSPVPPPFLTDNEGLKIWPVAGKSFDTVNVMAYDGGSPKGPLVFNFEQILKNFAAYGPQASQVNMGFEPGEQNGGGVWEGYNRDVAVGKFIKAKGFGGAMLWPINPDPEFINATKWCPRLASSLETIIAPTWPFGSVPTYSKCNPQSGWNM